MSDRKSLKEAFNKQEVLSSPEAIAFLEGKTLDGEPKIDKISNPMKNISSELSASDEKADGYRKRITTDLPPDVHQRLKLALAKMKTNSNKLVNALIVNFLDENDY